jgi:signal transduction histidine kinase
VAIRADGDKRAVVHAPLEMQGRAVGSLAVGIRTEPALSGVRAAGFRLAAVVVASILGVLVLGVLLSRGIIGQVRRLLHTSSAIGDGDLSARAPLESADELGDLARGINDMAAQLEASYETLELRVTERTEEVRRLLKERTEFFASLSHELRTPLAAILGEVSLLERSRRAGDATTARRLRYPAEQLLSLVNDVLELARAQSGRLELDMTDVSIYELVDEMRPTMEGLARRAGVEFAVDLPERLPQAHADRARLREVILNLVDNAVKYTPDGGAVRLTAAAPNGTLVLSVADTGVGIPADAVPLVFEPFYVVPGTSPYRDAPSTGLGLSLAKRLVEAHGGTIRVASAPGRGSTFQFELPRAGHGRV